MHAPVGGVIALGKAQRILQGESWPGIDYDSGGGSVPVDATDWTELTIINRENAGLRIDIEHVNEDPLILVVSSKLEALAMYAENWFVERAASDIIKPLHPNRV